MKRIFFLRGMLRRGIEVHRSRPFASSAAVSARPLSGHQYPNGLNVERKHSSDNQNAKGKAVNEESSLSMGNDLVITSIPQRAPEDEIECAWITDKAKALNSPDFARILKPRRLDLYEVRPTPDMGLGLFAKHDIKRGELILAERPLLVTPIRLRPGFKSFNTLLEAAITTLPHGRQADFNALFNAFPSDWCGQILGITLTNSFNISNDTYSLNGAVGKFGSRINHSCMPNALFNFKLASFSLQVYASRTINTGDQVFVSYTTPNSNFAERQAQLAGYGFVCNCPACINTTPKADQLRKSFEIEIPRLADIAIRNPSQIDQTLLENAVTLERDMVKEGLDSQFQFGSLLKVISFLYARLGNLEKSRIYRVRVEEFSYCEE